MHHLIIHSALTFERSSSVETAVQYRRYDASRASLNARLSCSLTPRGSEPRSIVYTPSEPLPGTSCLTFLIQRGIYSVSWCDCSSVGAPSGHLSVPGLPAGKRRRLHQIFWGGKGDSVLPEREKRKVLICSATRWVRGERRSG